MFASLLRPFVARPRRRRLGTPTRHRGLRLESLESRQLMSANPASLGAEGESSYVSRIINGTPTSGWEGVGLVGDSSEFFCSGVLISPQYVLTAGHCATGVANTRGRFQVGGTTYSTSQVVVHPQYNENAEPDQSNDIAIYKLSQAVTSVPFYPIYRSTPQVGQVLTLVGFGGGGTGASGSQGDFGTKRVGTTPIDAVTSKMIWWDFDNESESNTAPGDSGGPAFLNVSGSYYVAGITSGGSNADAGLGDESFDTRVDAYAAWIDSIVGTTTLPTVSLVATDASAAETASGATANPGVFTVTRSGATTAALTVSVSVSGTAARGTDYTALAASVVIPAGSASATVNVTPLDDSLVEATETVVLTLVSNSAYTVDSTKASATVSILDNDTSSLPTVSLVATDASAAETASGATANPGVFTVTRSGATTAALTVSVSVSGTATSGADYTALAASVVIPAGSALATVNITPLDDSLVEATETVMLTLASNSAYTVDSTKASATVSILDNDTPTPTSNDDFANRLAIGDGQVTASNAEATRESREPKNAGAPGGKSLWWSWTASRSGTVVITTAGSSFDTTLGVYTGTILSRLTSVASNDDDRTAADLTSRVSFSAVAGATYQISVDGYDGDAGTIVLTVSPQVVAPNDDFANRLAMTGTQVTATNAEATRETGEPKNAGVSGGKSLWWSWTAPSSGTVVMSTAGSSFDTTLGVYTGTTLSRLRSVVSNDDDPTADVLTSRVQFNAVAGTTYQISVDGYAGEAGSIVLTVTPPTPARAATAGRAATSGAQPATVSSAVSPASTPVSSATRAASPVVACAANTTGLTAARITPSPASGPQVDRFLSRWDSLLSDMVDELFR